MNPAERAEDFGEVLVGLARGPGLWAGAIDRANQIITESAGLALGVERCSIWLYSVDRQTLRCVDLFVASGHVHSAGSELRASDYPAYFQALETERTIAAHDAHTDPQTREFSDNYLGPLGITSMLDVPIREGGEMVGVVCHEHVGPARHWTPAEESFAASIGDLTSQAMETAKLRRSEEQLAKAQAMAHLGSWFWDLATDRLNWSDEMYRVYGHAPGSFDPDFDRVMAQVSDPDAHRLRSAFDRTRETGAPYREQHRVVWPDGQERFLECSGQANVDSAGEPTALYGTCHDITDLARAKSDAEAREAGIAHFRTLFDQAPQFILTTDLDLKITSINRTLAALTREEVVGARLTDFEEPSGASTLAAMAKKILDTGQVQSFEFRGVGDQEPWAWYDTHMGPIVLGGQITGFVAFAVDVTETRRLREQLGQSRTLEAIGRLAAGIAHDFNNLTMAIKGYSDLALRAARAGEDPVPLLERLARTVRRAESLASKLPTLRDEELVRPRLLDLNELVDNMSDLLGPLLREGITLATKLSATPVTVRADQGHLERILLNLAVNARDAMPDGGQLTVSVELVRDDASGEEAPGPLGVLSVSDTGTGMDEETRSHIFEPFFTTRSPGKGTGLGLFTSYALVRQQGGSITVETALGEGTTFEVSLPHVAGEPEPILRTSKTEAPPIGTETILAVEDDPDVGDFMAMVLEACGYNVLRARDGQEALDLVAHDGQEAFDLLLTDVKMPRMGGRELATVLRGSRPDLKVLFVSGHLGTTDASTLGEHPGEHFLRKPVAPTELAVEVRALLDL